MEVPDIFGSAIYWHVADMHAVRGSAESQSTGQSQPTCSSREVLEQAGFHGL